MVWNLPNSSDRLARAKTTQHVELCSCTTMPSFLSGLYRLKPCPGACKESAYWLSHLASPNAIGFLSLIASGRKYFYKLHGLLYEDKASRILILLQARPSSPSTAFRFACGLKTISQSVTVSLILWDSRRSNHIKIMMKITKYFSVLTWLWKPWSVLHGLALMHEGTSI